MIRWLLLVSMGFFAFGAGCADDADDGGADGRGGSAGIGGGGAGKGGSAGSADSAGASGHDSAGASGQGGQVSCDPPPPPLVGAAGASGGEGGTAGGGEGGTAGGGEGGTGGGSGGESGELLAPLSIAGSYEDDFGGTYTITSSQWLNPPAVYHISAYDNEERWIVAQNDEGNMYGPCRWSRYDWVTTAEGLFYCTTVYDAETEQEAREAEAPDASDPAEGGCNNFAWSQLTPQ